MAQLKSQIALKELLKDYFTWNEISHCLVHKRRTG
jgi:hypothetical protein